MNKAVLLEITGEGIINQKTSPEFMLLYQQSILLALKEQGILNDGQLKRCMDALKQQLK